MIEIHKKVIRYYIQHGLHYVNKYVNSVTSLQMSLISLIDEKLVNKITVEILFCLISTLVNWFISTYLSRLSTRVHTKKMFRFAVWTIKVTHVTGQSDRPVYSKHITVTLAYILHDMFFSKYMYYSNCKCCTW